MKFEMNILANMYRNVWQWNEMTEFGKKDWICNEIVQALVDIVTLTENMIKLLKQLLKKRGDW